MGGKKTRDGIKLSEIVKVALQAGAKLRCGNDHIYILNYDGLRPCPVATSTHAEQMVAPWLAQIVNTTKKDAYTAMRRGYL